MAAIPEHPVLPGQLPSARPARADVTAVARGVGHYLRRNGKWTAGNGVDWTAPAVHVGRTMAWSEHPFSKGWP